jgi:hypothetical protein
LLRADNHADAEAAFRKTVADAPDSAAVYNAAGAAFRPERQIAGGAEVFQRDRSGRDACRKIGRSARHGHA